MMATFMVASLVMTSGCGRKATSSDIGSKNIIPEPQQTADNSDSEVSETGVDSTEVEEDITLDFDADYMSQLTLVIPGDGVGFSDADLADNCMLLTVLYEEIAATLDYVPEVEVVKAPSPVELTFECLPAGEVVDCHRTKTEDMEKFLASVYGREFHIPEGTGIASAAEVTNIDGYLAEWGGAYYTAIETGWSTVESSSTRIVSDGFVELTTTGKYGARMIDADYKLITVWEPSSNSQFGWSLISWDMQQEELYDDSPDNEYHDHNVEAEIEQIKDWYYNPTSDVKKVSKSGGYDLNREYYYHDGQLFFVFMFNDSESHRIYYNNGDVIRYIDTEKNTYDFYDYAGNVPVPANILEIVAEESYND